MVLTLHRVSRLFHLIRSFVPFYTHISAGVRLVCINFTVGLAQQNPYFSILLTFVGMTILKKGNSK